MVIISLSTNLILHSVFRGDKACFCVFDSSLGRDLFMLTSPQHTSCNHKPFIILFKPFKQCLWKLPHLLNYTSDYCYVKSKEKMTLSMLLGGFWMLFVTSDTVCVVIGLKTWGSTTASGDGKLLWSRQLCSFLARFGFFQPCFCNNDKMWGMWQKSAGAGGAGIIHCHPVVRFMASPVEWGYVRSAASHFKQESHKSSGTVTTTQQLLSELFWVLLISSSSLLDNSHSLSLFFAQSGADRNDCEGDFYEATSFDE